LLFTDTDSLCYHIRNEDPFLYIQNNKDLFDLSDYPTDHFLYDPTNKKVMGKFKNESIKQITEFVGLRSKLYAFTTDDNDEHVKCKGVKKCVSEKIRLETYKEILFNRSHHDITQNGFVVKKHEVYTQTQKKVALSCNDDKIYICDDNIHTYNFGHKNIRKNRT